MEAINYVNSQAALSPSNMVQHISNEFWSCWRKEFLVTLQDSQKWKAPLQNFCVGNIAILKEDTQYNNWRLAKVIKVYREEKGYAQTVHFYLGYSDPTKMISCVLVNQIDKIVLLVHSDEEV